MNGVRVEAAYLGAGAQIELGATTLTFSPSSVEIPTSRARASVLHGWVGSSERVRELMGVVQKVAPLGVTVVITGPTGSGKGTLARALHRASPRAAKPFVVLDCGNLDPALMRAELFGHERGAFTGADQARAGVFEAAHGGTLFIDEIGELPLELQPRLLRVLDERAVQRLGSQKSTAVDVRVVAATHRDLPALVAAGKFREDLFFRLNVVSLEVPPLAERPEDVVQLAEHFLEELGAGHRQPLPGPVRVHLTGHRWPGNVRELRNAVERALALAGDEPLEPRHFKLAVPAPQHAAAAPLEQAERQVIASVLEKHRGNRTRTAEELGVALTTLRRKLRQYGLE